jgi:ribosomal protein S13
MKLPTTFQELDLTGFDIDKKQYNSINREMIDIACAVLQKNQVGIVTRSLQSALKYIYGIGGSADTVCGLLREWRSDHRVALKGMDKNLISVILEVVDDGVLDESDIPADYLTVMKQMAIAVYKLAYQNADTSVSGDRIKQLITENEVLKQQIGDFPQVQLELNFYKSECERQRHELKEAYININKQQLTESEEVRNKLDALYQERNNLIVTNNELAKRLMEYTDNCSLVA